MILVYKKSFLTGIFLLVLLMNTLAQQTTVSGYLYETGSKEPVLFATIFIDGTDYFTNSNEHGYFSLTVPLNTFNLSIDAIGYAEKSILIKGSNNNLNIILKTKSDNIEKVIVKAKKTSKNRGLKKVRSTQMSEITLDVKSVKMLPTIGGEVDLIKIAQLLPGVTSGTQGGSSFFVRGGDADQNLVLLDEATVYNISHMFGFFSVFNPDIIKSMTMLKGAFPAHYGGRLSSILDLRQKNGHMNKFKGAGGIGLLSSRLMLEGPIKKDTASFVIAARRTYIDKVMGLVGLEVPYYFYDFNAKLSWNVNEKNKLFFSTYYGNDVLSANGEDEESPKSDSGGRVGSFNFGFKLGNLTNTVRWSHSFNSKLFAHTSLIHTHFKYDINGSFLENNLLIKSDVRDIGIKTNFYNYLKKKTKIRFGAHIIEHIFRPNIVSTSGEITQFLKSKKGNSLYNTEIALFGNYEKELNKKLKISTGLRLSATAGSDFFYFNPEPRISGRYMLSKTNSLKLGYSRMAQYMHRVSSSTVALPTDLWYPISKNVKPQNSDQIALGYEHWLDIIGSSLTVETYYKWLRNLTEYKQGANLVLNDEFENELLQGRGKSYGFEVLLKRDEGRLNGWIGYTLSWSDRQFDALESGNWFPAKYDRRHNVSLALNYEISKRWHLGAVWVFTSGAKFTAQVGQYIFPNAQTNGIELIPLYTSRNAVSMSNSHRLDISLTRKSTKTKGLRGDWSFGAYNIYNYTQPYRIDVSYDPNQGYVYKQPGLFGFIPSIAYNFNF